MANLTQTPKIALYSAKALQMLEDYCRADGWSYWHADRDATGKVMLVCSNDWTASRPLSKIGNILAWTHNSRITNTIRTRAQDKAEYTLNGHTYSHSELNLLACLTLGKYHLNNIRFWWGAQAVDDFIGKAFNPMIATQRGVILEQIRQIEAECDQAVTRARNDYNVREQALRDERENTIKELKQSCQEKISKLNEMIALLG